MVPNFWMGSLLTKILGFQSKQKFGDPPTPALWHIWADRGVFWKVELGFWNFGYDFWEVGGDVWRCLFRHLRQAISAHVEGGRAKGLVCADPGARTPINMTQNYKKKKNWVVFISSDFWNLNLPRKLCFVFQPFRWITCNWLKLLIFNLENYFGVLYSN